MKNRLNFLFNTHLPFVRHPEYPHFLEEDWLFEAVNESYIPLLRMMFKLREEGIKFRLTFSLSPTLCFMLQDESLKEKLNKYLDSRLELGNKECQRLSDNIQMKPLAELYTKKINDNIDFYRNKCNGNILEAFKSLSDSGHIELITTCATHSYLPMFKDYPEAVNAQIETGVVQHQKTFEKYPDGFWLPECGYYPGLENILKRNGILWTSLASQAIFLSEEEPKYGNFKPIRCKNGLWCFGRDLYLSNLVWSSTEGYPADKDYREFYRDIGYDLPTDYIGPYIHEPDVRVFTGFKYWAITGNTADKVVYNQDAAANKVSEHSRNFIYHVKRHGSAVNSVLCDDPVFTVSFDTELFGHWWFEGVDWLENVIRLAANDEEISLITPTDYIAEDHTVQVLTPGESSWGENGTSQVWIDSSSNAKYVPYLLKSAQRMTELANRFPDQKSLKQRFITQAARETLLLMASDWLFIMHNHNGDEYSKKRLEGHIQNFNLVYEDMCKNAVNTGWLVNAERRNNIFPDFDYNIFSSKHIKGTSTVFCDKTN